MNKEIICTYYEVICIGADDCEGKHESKHVIAKKKTMEEANAYVKKWEETKQKAIAEGTWYGWHGYVYRDRTPKVRKKTIKESEENMSGSLYNCGMGKVF